MSVLAGSREEAIALMKSRALERQRRALRQPPEPGAREAEDPAERLRNIYHPRPKVVLADDEWISFAVNRNWIAPIDGYHRCLIDLFQLFYDLAELKGRGRLSPSELSNIIREIILDSTNESEYISLNQVLVHTYRGRHYLAHNSQTQIGTKRDWARKQVYEVRKHSEALQEWTRAKQVDSIARRFDQALRSKTVERRAKKIASLTDLIYVDTRNKHGRPAAWIGIPVDPLPDAKAHFQRLPGLEWTLRINRDGVPPEVLEHLAPSDLSPRVRNELAAEPIPWWCTSKELIVIAARTPKKDPGNSPLASELTWEDSWTLDRKEWTEWFRTQSD